MLNRTKPMAALSASLAFLLIAGPLTFADDLDNQLQDLQGQIDESRATQASWQEVIEEVSSKLKAIQADLDAANTRLKEIRAQQDAVNRQIRELENQIRVAEIHLKQRQAVLNQRVRAIYMHGQLNYLEVILGSKSFSDFANRLELLKRIIRADFDLIREIQAQKAAIEAKKAQIEEEKKTLDILAAEAEQTQAQIAAKKDEQQQVLESARSNKAAAAQLEADLIARSEQIQALIQQRLRERQSQGGSASYTQGTGQMSWPCNGPITSPFGYRVHPIFGTTIYHSGIDIGVDYGTPIHAADSGTVIYAGWISGYGNAVILDHGGGIQTLYGHNTSVAVSEGQSVSKGDVIAYAGSTGNSTGPHCHFEVEVNGTPVDPMGYL
ncbi:MAG: peptidoglycan DD-metalloendopeptidase family protein [Dialister sp.]|nr:peptidoglycan DD-metalloendopeptidase family protein [Dialister sp.]